MLTVNIIFYIIKISKLLNEKIRKNQGRKVKKWKRKNTHTHTGILKNKKNRNNFAFKQQQFKQAGITLVALVVTIIVLLILAGVTISLLLEDNGILKKVGEAEEIQRAAMVREEVTLAIYDNEVITSTEKTDEEKENIKTKTDVVNDLVEKGYLRIEEFELLKTEDTITIGNVTIDFQKLPKTYSITFDANGGIDAPEDQTKIEGIDTYLSTIIPNKTNYIFGGWSINSSNVVAYSPNDVYSINQNLNLFAIWLGPGYSSSVNAVKYRGNNENIYSFAIVGVNTGSVWGGSDGIYTDDSNIAKAAVHAGLVQLNENAVVKIKILPSRNSYSSSTQNGITTSNYGKWGGSYIFIE